MTPLFPPLQRQLIEALKDVFDKGYFSDQVLEHYFKSNRKWGSRDRKQFAAALYGIVRWLRPLILEAGLEWTESWSPRQEMIAQFTGLKGLHDQDWQKVYQAWLKCGDELEANSAYTNSASPELRHSLTDYCLELFKSEMAGDLDKELAALNTAAPVFLRCNTLKASPTQLVYAMENEGIELKAVEGLTHGFKLSERKAIFRTKAFQQGFFEMQDGGSQKIAEFAQVEPGYKVVDACAGAGGKSLHLAALMKNKGRIVAMDIFPKKLEELERRARRAGAFNLETRVIDSSKAVKRLENMADRVLLDVPCSGTGVFRRNPDSKWRLSCYEVEALRLEQHKILSSYSRMVKPGGKLVYSTCSLLKSENEAQVAEFLKTEAGAGFSLEAEAHILPSESAFDGFYMARLQRS